MGEDRTSILYQVCRGLEAYLTTQTVLFISYGEMIRIAGSLGNFSSNTEGSDGHIQELCASLAAD